MSDKRSPYVQLQDGERDIRAAIEYIDERLPDGVGAFRKMARRMLNDVHEVQEWLERAEGDFGGWGHQHTRVRLLKLVNSMNDNLAEMRKLLDKVKDKDPVWPV